MMMTYNKGFEPDLNSVQMANFVFEIDAENELYSLVKSRRGDIFRDEPLDEFLAEYGRCLEWEMELLKGDLDA